MDASRALLAGGGLTVAASIAIVCAFTVSNSVALADAAGQPLAVAPLVVPAQSPTAAVVVEPTTTPTPTPSPTPSASHAPQIVPAPAPRDVAASAQPEADTSEPAASEPAAQPSPSASERSSRADVFAQFKKDGNWKKVVAWAKAHGWTADEIRQWIRSLREQGQSHESHDGEGWGDSQRSDRSAHKTPAQTGEESDRDFPRSHVGSKRDRSRVSPDQRD